MKIALHSDIHLEFGQEYSPNVDGADVIVLAGDIHWKNRAVPWIVKRFKGRQVIYVTGNHEYYKGKLGRDDEKIAEAAAPYPWLHFLQNNSVEIDGVTFLGCTLWTDYKLTGNQPHTMVLAQQGMNDYDQIRVVKDGYRRARPQDMLALHNESVRWLTEQLSLLSGPVVVVTHHGPYRDSINSRFASDPLNGCYASDLSRLIMEHQPLLWLHGHTHAPCDYTLGETRVVCNAKGYPMQPTGFDPGLILDI